MHRIKAFKEQQLGKINRQHMDRKNKQLGKVSQQLEALEMHFFQRIGKQGKQQFRRQFFQQHVIELVEVDRLFCVIAWNRHEQPSIGNVGKVQGKQLITRIIISCDQEQAQPREADRNSSVTRDAQFGYARDSYSSTRHEPWQGSHSLHGKGLKEVQLEVFVWNKKR